ncbi:hypothetical protein Y032_0083g1686 [Ancylostoma ceylanicum]|uniref:Uncharacterized protein n=1 Tax=Ancylostoma ceylanicum TaxID=53326 RepID=A0A016TRA0_9BILA|nr:hypothetical protein Y032_0083g1686 [Ancylostoma ceylanicum]
MKRRGVDISCSQEWKGSKAKEIGNGIKLFYNGLDTRRNGVATAVGDNIRDKLTPVKRVSHRAMAIRISTEQLRWTVVSAHAPYHQLANSIRSVPEDDY